MLIAIDPGKHSVAWACFDDVLLSCGFLEAKDRFDLAEQIGMKSIFDARRAVIEMPRIYPQASKWKGDPDDVLQVVVTVGQLVQRMSFADLRLVRPHEWKGSRPKAIHGRSILATLSKVEHAVYEQLSLRASARHNVVDAIGLGLWRLGRRLKSCRELWTRTN